GTISVSGGQLHLLPTQNFGYFPYVRLIPGVGTPIANHSWVVETRMGWPTGGGANTCITRFMAPDYPINLCPCPPPDLSWLNPSPVAIARMDSPTSVVQTLVKAGDTMMALALNDAALHVYRWESNGSIVSFFLDGALVFAGNYNGTQPNNPT